MGSVMIKNLKIKRTTIINALILLGLFSFSLPVLFTDSRPVDFFQQAHRLINDFFPPDYSVIHDLGYAVVETLRISIISTIIGTVISIVLAVMASRQTAPLFLRTFIQGVLIFVRTIPSLVLAVIAVALIGTSPTAGVLALTIYSVSYLGKFFQDILDTADPRPALWLKSQNLSQWQIFQFGYWPSLKASLFSKFFWMLEYNIRSASIIGYVGAGGIGVQLHIYQEFGQWRRFTAALLVILVLVIFLEIVSQNIKKRTKHVRSS